MRTTLSIDPDLLAIARDRATREGVSIGVVISNLARLGLTGQSARATERPVVRNGFPQIQRDGPTLPVTMAMVNELRDDLP
ncbi:MAG: hypothetical protein MUF14_00810 [Hyphomonadaceae bacterium]|jgi:hypothetical protein|nr:hypothetical protein [Hyphomonadaceae bacterium]